MRVQENAYYMQSESVRTAAFWAHTGESTVSAHSTIPIDIKQGVIWLFTLCLYGILPVNWV